MRERGLSIPTVGMRGLVDPEIRGPVEEFLLPEPSGEGLRALRDAPAPEVELSDAVERTERLVPGDPAVAVRVHRPVGHTAPSPAIVTIHGGGLVFGSYDMDSPLLDRWCPRFGIVGVSVQYRLAPENPYPDGLEDCYKALRWTYDNADELGVDRSRIGLFGISAGGGIAAALALLARDRGEVPVAFQALDCPMLDDRQQTGSIGFDDLYVWSREWNDFGWRSYLGSLYGTEHVPAYAAAARVDDVANLPPAFVSVGTIDGFRDEDVEYAMRLNRGGVPCELHVYSGLPHGYSLASDASAVKLATAAMDSWLGRQLHRLATDD